MTDVPIRKTPPRQQIHQKFCRGTQCFYESGRRHLLCGYLDELLDLNDELLLHAKANTLVDMHMDTVLVHGVEVGQGLALAVKVVDPYVRVSAGQDPDCPGCEKGIEHYHRKSDGSPVRSTT